MVAHGNPTDMPRGMTTTIAQTTSIPIIVVPGMMGSRLAEPTKGHELVWNPYGVKGDPGDAVADDDRLAELNQPLEPDEYNEYEFSSLTAKVFNRARSIPHFYNLVTNHYGPLVFALDEKLTPKGFKVYACGYDWRQDNADSARRLASVVDQALRETSAKKVIIIAHSMGGLVSRYYCSSKGLNGESNVRALFLLGTPNHGAPKGYRSLKMGLDWLNDTTMGFVLRMGDDSRHMIHRFPSAFQLLPTRTYFIKEPRWLLFPEIHAKIPLGTTDPAVIYKNDFTGIHEIIDDEQEQNLCKNYVDRAIVFHKAIENYTPPNTFVVYSGDLGTETYYALGPDPRSSKKAKDGRLWFEKVLNITVAGGDETVPAFSASELPGVVKFMVQGVEHCGLCTNSQVIDYLLQQIPKV